MKACNKTVALHIGVGQNFQALQTFCKEILNLTKTSNYDLNQWDAGDRVLREDFNADNQKLDAALAAVNGRIDSVNPLVKLRTVSCSGTQQDVDVSDVDWNVYRALHIYFDLQFPSTSATGNLRLNNRSDSSAYLTSSSNTQSSLAGFGSNYSNRITGVLQLMPGGVGMLGILDYVGHYPGHSYTSCQVVTADTLETVNFILSAAPVSSRYILYGLKK